MDSTPKTIAQRFLDTMSAKDKAASLALLTDDAVLVDPHYPNPRMVGRTAIGEGLDFAFQLADRLQWTVVRTWENTDSVALQVETQHLLSNGMELTPAQVFVVDVKGGLITSWQSFCPYPPPAPA